MKKKILIIDDEKEMVNYLSRKLVMENFEPLVAYDGQAGLEIMEREKVDAVIADNVMGDMDGYAFCKKLKESKTLKDIPILICTAHANEEKAFRKLGIDDYIVKPFKFDYLFESLDRIFSRASNKIKFKKVLVQADHAAGIESAFHQIEDYGFRIDFMIVPEDSNIIEEAIRHQSDIVIFNILSGKKTPELLIATLKSYVEFKDLIIVPYVNPKNLNEFKKDHELYLENLKSRCRYAGADGWLESLDRESILNVLFEHCKG